MRRVLPLLLLLAAAPAALAATGAWHDNEQSRVRLVTPWTVAPAAGEVVVGLEFETIEGWHVYWKSSGDAGYPPAIGFEATPQVVASEILWPAPERYHLPGDLVALGYERHVVYPLRLELAAEPGATLVLAGDLDYLVCEVDCVPYSYRLEVEQPLAAAGGEPVEDAEAAALVSRWRARVPRPAEAVAGVETDGVLDLSDPERPALEVRFAGLVPAAGEEPALFLEASDTFDSDTPELATDGPVDGTMKGGGPPVLRFRVPLSFREKPETLPGEAELAWTVTGVETVAGEAVAVEARRTVPARTAPPVPHAAPPRAGLGKMLLWAFLGGLLLHLAPTVLPLTLGRLAEIGSDAGGRTAALATAAGALFAAAFLPFVPLGPGGGWGAQLQAPVPVAALALAATLVALNLWGLLGLPLRRAEAGMAGGAGELARGLLVGAGVLVLGLVWNLPPLAWSLGPALAPAGVSAAPAPLVALALGAGLALPFVAAAAAPGGMARLLPAGAAGRARLAEGLGFVEAGAVLWLLYLLSRQVTGEGLAFVQLALLALAMVAWWRHSTRRRLGRAVLAALLAVLAAAVLWLSADHRLGGGTEQAANRAPRPHVYAWERIDSKFYV